MECRAAVPRRERAEYLGGHDERDGRGRGAGSHGAGGRDGDGAAEGWVGAVVREWRGEEGGEWTARRKTVERVWEGVKGMAGRRRRRS